MENSKIEWTTHTFNPVMGCTKVSPACKNCYAERDMDMRLGKVQWGPNGTRVLTSAQNWKKPLSWNRDALLTVGDGPFFGKVDRPRVFCASLADVFEEWSGPILSHHGVPVMICENGHHDEWNWATPPKSIPCSHECGKDMRPMTMDDVRNRLFKLIDETPMLDWLLLTKRPENILKMWPMHHDASADEPIWFRPNVWLGATAENQDWANQRVPHLLDCRKLSPVLFLSCEPLLGPIDLRRAHMTTKTPTNWPNPTRVDWVIAGGESGPNARPSHPDWFRSLRDQCQEKDIAFLFKQWGEWAPASSEFGMYGHVMPDSGVTEGGTQCTWIDWDGQTACPSASALTDQAYAIAKVGKKRTGRKLDGQLHDAFPMVEEVKQ